jgi:hypothetical protein
VRSRWEGFLTQCVPLGIITDDPGGGESKLVVMQVLL